MKKLRLVDWVYRSAIACCLWLLIGCNSADIPQTTTVQVQRVVSGQTLEVKIDRAITKVRLIGIDAPDLDQKPWGIAAKQQLAELVNPANKIQLEIESDRDPYNRILAYVWQNDTLVNEQLVKQGYVLANTQFPHKYSRRLLDAQAYARIMGYGIWNPQQPMGLTPAEFRSYNKSE